MYNIFARPIVTEFIDQVDVKAILGYDASILLLGQRQHTPHQAWVHDLTWDQTLMFCVLQHLQRLRHSQETCLKELIWEALMSLLLLLILLSFVYPRSYSSPCVPPSYEYGVRPVGQNILYRLALFTQDPWLFDSAN